MAKTLARWRSQITDSVTKSEPELLLVQRCHCSHCEIDFITLVNDSTECPHCVNIIESMTKHMCSKPSYRRPYSSKLTVKEPQLYQGTAKHPDGAKISFDHMTRYGASSYVDVRSPDSPEGNLIGYSRTSGPTFAACFSHTAVFEEYAKTHTKTLSKIGFDYAISGAKGFEIQKALNVLLWELKPGDVLMTTYKERLTRDNELMEQILEFIADRGASYVVIKEDV